MKSAPTPCPEPEGPRTAKKAKKAPRKQKSAPEPRPEPEPQPEPAPAPALALAPAGQAQKDDDEEEDPGLKQLRRAGWEAVLDPDQNSYYYYHAGSGVTQWEWPELPDDVADLPEVDVVHGGSTADAKLRARPGSRSPPQRRPDGSKRKQVRKVEQPSSSGDSAQLSSNDSITGDINGTGAAAEQLSLENGRVQATFTQPGSLGMKFKTLVRLLGLFVSLGEGEREREPQQDPRL